MSDQPNYDSIINELQTKYKQINQDTEDHLLGLLYSKPITYWDYIQTDALLNLQIQRTTLPDEMVFIAYHQINELIFKMILWEIQQVAEKEDLDAAFFENKIMRISRYFDMLTTSFNIMRGNTSLERYSGVLQYYITIHFRNPYFESSKMRFLKIAKIFKKVLISSIVTTFL